MPLKNKTQSQHLCVPEKIQRFAEVMAFTCCFRTTVCYWRFYYVRVIWKTFIPTCRRAARGLHRLEEVRKMVCHKRWSRNQLNLHCIWRAKVRQSNVQCFLDVGKRKGEKEAMPLYCCSVGLCWQTEFSWGWLISPQWQQQVSNNASYFPGLADEEKEFLGRQEEQICK